MEAEAVAKNKFSKYAAVFAGLVLLTVLTGWAGGEQEDNQDRPWTV